MPESTSTERASADGVSTDGRDFRKLAADLDRCEHGRHEGDVCANCGPPGSKGNPLWRMDPIVDDEGDESGKASGALRLDRRFSGRAWPERLIGFGLDGVPICVPPRGEPGSAPPRPADYYRADLA